MEIIARIAIPLTLVASVLLIYFGSLQARQKENPTERQRGFLMIACGIIFIGNVLIWTL